LRPGHTTEAAKNQNGTIAGVDLPRNKQHGSRSRNIFGSEPRAKKILEKANVDPSKKIQDLGENEVNASVR